MNYYVRVQKDRRKDGHHNIHTAGHKPTRKKINKASRLLLWNMKIAVFFKLYFSFGFFFIVFPFAIVLYVVRVLCVSFGPEATF